MKVASTNLLPVRPCPGCDREIAVIENREVKTAATFDDCLRKCFNCGLGLSNSKVPGSETAIYRDPLDNVHDTLRDGFLDALSSCANQLNRDTKRRKAAYWRSEDALTWNYFEHLRRTRQLRQLGFFRSSNEPLLLLWGSQVGQSTGLKSTVQPLLKEISAELGEDPSRRTEPDVILDFGSSGVAVIEVKYFSPNDVKTDQLYRGWPLYLGGERARAFKNSAAIRESGLYELARNWRFGYELSERLGVPVVVANLGRARLFKGSDDQLLDRFERQLNQDPLRRFERLTWHDVLHRALPRSELLPYFKKKYPVLFNE